MELQELEVYKLTREISRDSWGIYKRFDWQTKKITGDQFISAIDSIGANIAEGFGRFHYLDKNKFNYNARGSLFESIYWIEIITERHQTLKDECDVINKKLKQLNIKLNNYITSTRNQVK